MSAARRSSGATPLTTDEVLGLIRAAGRKGLTVRDLVDRTAVRGRGARSERRRRLREVLKELDERGQIIAGKSKRVIAMEHSELVTGRLQMLPGRQAKVVPAGVGAGPVQVAGRDLRGAGDGDLVVVRILHRHGPRQGRGGQHGVVVRILQQSQALVVGRWTTRGGQQMIEPIGGRPGTPIVPVAIETEAQPEEDELVVVSLEAGRRSPHGTVLERLGKIEQPGVVERAVVRMLGIPDTFPQSCLDEAAALPEPDTSDPEVTQGRWDLRDDPAITIDPVTALDFDDAVDARRGRDEEIVVQVHIADVSYHVRPGSALDQEARRRGTSVYLPSLCIPMLPERVSSDLCCLREGVDRPAVTVRFSVRPDGSVVAARMRGSIIHSRRRCTYQEVAAWLELPDDQWPEEARSLTGSLRLLDEAARRLRQARHHRGSLDLELEEPELVLDASGQVQSIRVAERTEAHRLIEDLMVAANECVARFLLRHDQPALHRVHEEPSPDRLEALASLLAELGYEVDLGQGVDLSQGVAHGGLQHLLELSRDRPEHRLVATMVLRSLSRAHYSPDPRGHHALAADAYLHFTSPIRRYPDLICHRMLLQLIKEGASLPEEERATVDVELAQLGGSCSATEQRAETAEREARRWLTVLYLRDRVGEIFPGHVTGLTDFGVFVELEPFQMDGMIHISDLSDDYYSLDPRGHQLLGERTNRRYRLGDAIRTRLLRVDTGAMKLQLATLDDADERPRRGKHSGRPASGKRSTSRPARRSGSRRR